MRTHVIYLSIIAGIIFLGFKNKDTQKPETSTQGKVTGIGGIFFKAKDVKTLKKWYADNLGFPMNEYGAMFEYKRSDDAGKKCYLQWSLFNEKTTYFKPSEKDLMINYRVENLEDLLKKMKANGVTVVDSVETYDYGKFVHIMDCENNKIELWEPIDGPFTKQYEGTTIK